MLVGEIFLTAFITVLFERLASGEVLNFARQLGIHAKLEKCNKMLLKIHAILGDAEEKQITNRAVKMWLDDLQDLAYDLDDILDDLATEALKRKLMAQPQASTNNKKVSKFITTYNNLSPNVVMFNYNMGSKIDEISARLHELSTQKNYLNLEEENVGRSRSSNWTRQRFPSTSLVESRVYGRENDKKEILELLLRSEARDDQILRVIPMLGMGGVGKTTLAQLIYNDDEVNRYFDLKAWACVSDDFDVFEVTKSILESLTLDSCYLNTISALQEKLKQKVFGRKFLLVLDDVWNQNYEGWDILRRPFHGVAPGSKIIVTTRNASVASMMSTVPAFHLKELGNDSCLSLFAQHALDRDNFDEHTNLKEIGKKIVNKCKGLPLAIKTLAGLLRTKLHQHKWEDICNSKIWDLPEQQSAILPALRLSYHHLPTQLKQCFAYCMIFPKGYEVNKDELVLLWMAVGLLHQPNGRKRMEITGCEYFDDLLSRSFFQQSLNSKSRFVMHDLIHELAEFVAGELCFRLEDKLESNEQHKISKRARHSSHIRQKFEVFQKFKDFHKVQHLRTFIPLPICSSTSVNYLSHLLLDLLPNLQCLRVLSLSGYCITELPNSIGELKHLRYLDLSNTSIKQLPESVCTLFNLQTLSLRGCEALCKLPINIGNLINLRHLDNAHTSELGEMPSAIGKLTSLQTLSKIVVGKSSGLGLRELRDLMLLSGSLCIVELQNVMDIRDAKEAKLRHKQDLDELGLVWSCKFDDSRDEKVEMDVLDMLQPHRNLKKLKIEFYGGVKFPSWIGDPSIFSKVVEVHLNGCAKCTSLPTLGQLPVLKDLCIQGMYEVRRVGVEFYKNGYPLEFPFPSLKTLRFEDMPEWEEWLYFIGSEEVVGHFPCLCELTISSCPKLIRIPLLNLPSLRRLDLAKCRGLVLKSFANLNSLISLSIDSVTELTCLPEEFMQFSEALEVLELVGCGELVTLWQNGVTLESLVSLKNIFVQHCLQLVSLGEEEQGLPCNLEVLKLAKCYKLERLPNGLNGLTSLRELCIWECPKLVSFPAMGAPPLLRRLWINDCVALESLPNEGMFRLEELMIENCSALKLWPASLPTTLKTLSILNCTSLESVMHFEDNSSTLSIEYLYVSHLPIITMLVGSLHNFASVIKLEVVGCDDIEYFPERGLPTPNLRSLKIWNCMNLRSLPNRIDSLTSLESLLVVGCQNLESFPNGDFPPSLTSLYITKCDKLKPLSEWGLPRLTSLKKFSIDGGYPELVSLSESLFPPALTSFEIQGLPNLESLSKGIQNLTSLQKLYIEDCPKLWCLPEEDLLAMLSSLVIWYCPLLKQLCLKDKGKYWPKIVDIPRVEIDGHSITN